MVGDYKIGRGGRQRGLRQSPFCNDFKVLRLAEPTQSCHGDIITREFSAMFPNGFDREESDGVVLSSKVLNYMSRLREEPPSEEGSSTDEGVPPKGSGSRGHGKPMIIGVGHISRELCDGQTLASQGRWPVASRRYPDTALWRSLAAKFIEYSRKYGTTELLMKLALGRVDSCPVEAESTQALESETLDILAEHGWKLERDSDDRTEKPVESPAACVGGPGGGNRRFRLRRPCRTRCASSSHSGLVSPQEK